MHRDQPTLSVYLWAKETIVSATAEVPVPNRPHAGATGIAGGSRRRLETSPSRGGLQWHQVDKPQDSVLLP